MNAEAAEKFREACELVREQLWNGMDVPHVSEVDGLCEPDKVWLLGYFSDEQLQRVLAARMLLAGLRKSYEALG